MRLFHFHIQGLLLAFYLAACSAAPPPPNIILIVADDLGYSDIAPFGSEIKTPTLDALAEQGVRLTGFYTATKCNPTRAMLMSGADNNLSGLGPRPSYHLNPNMTALPQALKAAGYYTFMTGKWDLGKPESLRPINRGFDETLSMLPGSASHYGETSAPFRHPVFSQNGKIIAEPKGQYVTRLYTDAFLAMLDKANGRPFFGFLSYTAPHWPLQVSQPYIDMYDGVYDAGWQVMRQARLKRQTDMKLFPNNKTNAPKYNVENWDSLDNERKAYEARRMQIYAGMVTYMDEQIQRVISALQNKGLLDNTIIIFMSDNGGDGETVDKVPMVIDYGTGTFDNRYENMGKIGSFILREANWGYLSNAPFARYKGYAYEGGIAAPMIIRLPDGTRAGEIEPALFHIMDIFPTFLDLAGVKRNTWPAQLQGESQTALIKAGKPVAPNRALAWYYAPDGNKGRAVRQGQWKLVWQKGSNEPHLFNVATDRGETTNLAAQYPKVQKALFEAWQDYAVRNNIKVR